MKAAILTKFLFAAALVAAPVALHAKVASREGSPVDESENLATGTLVAALLVVTAVVGGAIALSDNGTPASA